MRPAGHVSWFADIALSDRADVGGKGGSLGELQRAGVAVPPGFVVRTAAFERFIAALERDAPVRILVADLDPRDLEAITAASNALRRRIEQSDIPQDVAAEIAWAHAALCAGAPEAPVAVRSSATTEDAGDASFAGLQDTYLWVKGADHVLRMVRSCWASLYSVESIAYRRSRAFQEHDVAMAVVVQTMVDARSAGVMFTRSPVTGDRSVIAIEGSWGLGSSVVGGEVTPDRWVIGKITGEISVREISDKTIQHLPAPTGGVDTVPVADDLRRAACMTDDELQALRTVARGIERHYGCAQDIEWAVDRANAEILILQSRPETVWSAKDDAPAARAAENPLSHVLSIFGGRPVTLTAREIAEITRLLEESSFDELQLEIDGLKLHLRRGSAAPPQRVDDSAAAGLPAQVTPIVPDDARPADKPIVRESDLQDVLAPMLGTFYRAPKPGEPPFVEVGAPVEADTIIGIIEVMKLMNTVRAGLRGTVAEIPGRDGALVEYGETLLRVRRANQP